ncbi:hypothetical protein ACWF62_16840 [Rhodococcus sp. NPDC054953]
MGDTRAACPGRQRRRRGGVTALTMLTVLCLALAIACGALVWQHRGVAADETARRQAMAAAERTAMNLATVDHTHARSDVDRVLAGATGDFRDQFAESADSFVSVVEDTEVTTVADRADAAVESWQGDHGTVLVQVASTVTNRTAPEPQSRVWRLRMTMDRVGEGYKTAHLEYVA